MSNAVCSDRKAYCSCSKKSFLHFAINALYNVIESLRRDGKSISKATRFFSNILVWKSLAFWCAHPGRVPHFDQQSPSPKIASDRFKNLRQERPQYIHLSMWDLPLSGWAFLTARGGESNSVLWFIPWANGTLDKYVAVEELPPLGAGGMCMKVCCVTQHTV